MKELPKAYNPKEHEESIYKHWEENGFFKPKGDVKKKPFTIIMPPPNANDSLHIGHARFVFIEDILTRYNRMQGRPTLWAPGADHAGIETQYVFVEFEREHCSSDRQRDRHRADEPGRPGRRQRVRDGLQYRANY